MSATRMYKGWLVVGSFLFLLVGTSAFTQEKGKDIPKEEANKEPQPRVRSLVRAGYTRPGNPADKINKKGEIIQMAHEQDPTGPIIGSTVYFAVFRLSGPEGEALGSELAGLPDVFVEGRSYNNSVSPSFDRQAKYLYLYQIVNDRGLNPPKEGILPASDVNITTANIADFAVRLVVDPRYITSWGYFKNIGFEAKVTDRKVGKGGIVAAAGEETEVRAMAFSSNPAVVNELPHKRFQDRSPAYGLGKLLDNFGLDKSNLNLQNSSAFNTLRKRKEEGKVISAAANNEMKSAVEGGLEPDYVQIVYHGFQDEDDPALDGRHIGTATFRVDFKKNNMLQVGQHSVVIGFTSDLPPTDEPVRVAGQMPTFPGGEGNKAKNVNLLQQVAFQDEVVAQGAAQAATAGAVGTAPTPKGGAQLAGALQSAMSGGGAPLGSGGVGGGGLPFPGAGFGAARVPTTAGGSGQGSNQGQGTQNQTQQQQTPNINFNATLINQQSQLQAQLQAQLQLQKQNNNNNGNCHPGNVVPEPSAIILGVLGVPALFFYRRRGRTQIVTVP